MAMEQTKQIPVASGSAHTSNGTAVIRFLDVPPLNMGETYVRWVDVAIDVRFASGAGLGATIPDFLVHNVIRAIDCRVNGGHVFFDFAGQAGTDIHKLIWVNMGRRPESPGGSGATATSVAAAGTTDVNLKLHLPIGFNWGAQDPDEANVPLRELQAKQVQITLTWANGASGGDFDTNVAGTCTITSANTSIREVTVALMAREEKRAGAYLTWRTQALAGVEERPTAGNHTIHAMVELPTVNGAGVAATLTETFVTVAGRTRYDYLNVDGVQAVFNTTPNNLITCFNLGVEADSRITRHEAGTTRVVPIYAPRPFPGGYKLSKVLGAKEHPILRVSGTTTTPRIGMLLSRILTPAAAQESLGTLGVSPEDAGKATRKTLAKTALPDAAVNNPGSGARYPLKV